MDDLTMQLMGAEKSAADLVTQYEKHQADVERLAGDDRLTPEARSGEIAKLREQVEPTIVAARDDLLSWLGDMGTALDDQERIAQRAAWPAPKGEQWTEANARASFVEQDLQAAFERDPLEVVQAFRDALAEGDTEGAWLIYRAGERILKAGKAVRAVSELMNAALTAWPVDEKAKTAINKHRAKMVTLVNQLRQIRTAQEKKEFGARYAVRPEYIP